jgi:hypothetical protein
MTMHRRLFRSALTLLLAVAVSPAWACLSACNTGGQSLDCIKLCSRSHALMTDNGVLPSLSESKCDVSIEQAPAVLGAVSFQLDAPALAATIFVACTEVTPLSTVSAQASRGPPTANPYLRYSHPQANAPPSFC